jgi:dienelactone hydrolase
MAGNAKEWCWNPSGGGRLILGGGYDEPNYMFNDWDAKPPFERAANFGFRLVRDLPGAALPKAATGEIPPAFRDYEKERPVSDATFSIYRSIYSHDKTPLDAKTESYEETPDWRTETVSFRAANGVERVPAYVYLPKRGAPPYQTVLVFPGAGALHQASVHESNSHLNAVSYLARTGRAAVIPIYQATFQRRGELQSPPSPGCIAIMSLGGPKTSEGLIDYLETRKDLDAGKLAFWGFSWGGAMGAILPAIEPRIKVVMLVVGGLYFEKTLPEVDQINFARLIKAPVLMVNARYDHFFPVETSQKPLFRAFAAPGKDKRHIVVDGPHNLPLLTYVKESLAWLDRYFGPVSQ